MRHPPRGLGRISDEDWAKLQLAAQRDEKPFSQWAVPLLLAAAEHPSGEPAAALRPTAGGTRRAGRSWTPVLVTLVIVLPILSATLTAALMRPTDHGAPVPITVLDPIEGPIADQPPRLEKTDVGREKGDADNQSIEAKVAAFTWQNSNLQRRKHELANLRSHVERMESIRERSQKDDTRKRGGEHKSGR